MSGRHHPVRLVLAALLCLVFCAAPALAGQFGDLATEERKVLAPLESQWDSFSPEKQERLLRGARRWTNMTPEERAVAGERLRKWKSLTPEEREKIRDRFDRFRKLPPIRKSDCAPPANGSRSCRPSGVRSCGSAGSP